VGTTAYTLEAVVVFVEVTQVTLIQFLFIKMILVGGGEDKLGMAIGMMKGEVTIVSGQLMAEEVCQLSQRHMLSAMTGCKEGGVMLVVVMVEEGNMITWSVVVVT
jgi:hypothetical protein